MNNKAHLRPKDYDSNGDIIPMSMKEEKGDLISRDYVSNKICNLYSDGEKANKKDRTINEVMDIIDNAPTVAERPQGEWSDLSTDGRHTGWIVCSVCGQEPPNESNLRTNFCPNCGADMRGTV